MIISLRSVRLERTFFNKPLPKPTKTLLFLKKRIVYIKISEARVLSWASSIIKIEYFLSKGSIMHSLNNIPSVINLIFVLFLSIFSSKRMLYPTKSPRTQFFFRKLDFFQFFWVFFLLKINLCRNSRTNGYRSNSSRLSDADH